MQRKHMGFCLSPGNVKANLDQFTRLIQQRVSSWVGRTEPGQEQKQPCNVCLDTVVSQHYRV